MNEESLKEAIKEAIQEILFSEEEYTPFDRLLDSVKELLDIAHCEQRVERCVAICDKFEDYMQNIGRLNILVNEFKGLVSIVRSEAVVVKDQNRRAKRHLKQLLEILSEEL